MTASLAYAPTIEYDPYSVAAMLDILRARVATGLQPGVVDRSQLERIADHAAGSARHGVQALRSAVELGIERGHTEVQEEDIDDCFAHADDRIRTHLLNSLPAKYHRLYQVIRDAGEEGILAGDCIKAYDERTEGAVTRQMVGRYRRKLQRYGLVEKEGEGRWARYTVVDKTLAAPLAEERTATVSNGP